MYAWQTRLDCTYELLDNHFNPFQGRLGCRTGTTIIKQALVPAAISREQFRVPVFTGSRLPLQSGHDSLFTQFNLGHQDGSNSRPVR